LFSEIVYGIVATDTQQHPGNTISYTFKIVHYQSMVRLLILSTSASKGWLKLPLPLSVSHKIYAIANPVCNIWPGPLASLWMLLSLSTQALSAP